MTADDGPRFRCDYCGQLTPLAQVYLHWVHADTFADGTELVTSAMYCSEPCGEWAANRGGANRG